MTMWRLWRQAFRAKTPRSVCEGARLEDIAALNTLAEAWGRVRANKGGPGGDGLTIDELEAGIDQQLPALAEALLTGRYRPSPLRRAPIAKKDGGRRWLAIPCLIDRISQVAALIALSPDIDVRMSEMSWGYRPGRGVDDALAAVNAALEDGFRWIVDADIKRYFDSVPHQRLMEDVSIWIDDERVINLIALWLASFGTRGIAQGAPISPLLANIFLHPLDRLIAAEGHKVVRYADDFLILSRDHRAAKQALTLARQLLAMRGLRLNHAKTRILAPGGIFTFLGKEIANATGRKLPAP
jgi:CRISPR-associated protein Cas1